jgi:hypothetical protein
MNHEKPMIDTTKKMSAMFAAIDNKKMNKLNAQYHDDANKAFATDLYNDLNDAYYNSNVYMTNRKNYISIAVQKPSLREDVSAEVIAIERYVKDYNIVIDKMKSGNIVYKIKSI